MIHLLQTRSDINLTILRLALGLIMLPHGAQKLFGWFGGGGFSGTINFFQSQLGIPPFITVLVIATEFFGSLLLVFGLLSRLAALALIANMLGAILLVNGTNGFFWTAGGIEFHLLIIAVALVILLAGGGAYSVDQRLTAQSPVSPGQV